jgi:hypothetical protein
MRAATSGTTLTLHSIGGAFEMIIGMDFPDFNVHLVVVVRTWEDL